MGPVKLPFVSLHRPVDQERWEEGEGSVGGSGAEAVLTRKTPGLSVADGSAEGQALEQAVFVVLPKVEAEPADNIRPVLSVGRYKAPLVEDSHPVLQGASANISVHIGAGAAVG